MVATAIRVGAAKGPTGPVVALNPHHFPIPGGTPLTCINMSQLHGYRVAPGCADREGELCNEKTSGDWRHGGQMKSVCLVLGDNVRAKLYQTTSQPQELQLIYHQVNFGGSISDFAGSLCKRLSADLRGGKFDALVLMTSREFLMALEQNMDDTCRHHLLAKTVLSAGQFPEQELILRLKDLLAATVYDRAGYAGDSG
jgi:hypothetical protein